MIENGLLSHPYLLQAEDLTLDDIYLIFNQAKFFKDDFSFTKKYDYLKGISLSLAFFEASTRTRLSFELAAKRLSADVFSFSSATSSLSKGESLIDTLKTMEAMGVHIYVVRHSCSGVPFFLQSNTSNIIINAGDGKHEHPTQALLDSFTLYQHFGKFEGLKVCIIGDILHSRVARSNISLLNTLGAEIAIYGPGTLLPKGYKNWNIKLLKNINEAVEWSNVIMLLRLQKERMDSGLIPSVREFSNFYGISYKHITKKPELVILHPGPVNYGIELQYELSNYPNVLIQTQVTHGVFIRMAILALMSKFIKPNLG